MMKYDKRIYLIIYGMKKIVTIGGWNWHSSILKWLHKHFTNNDKFREYSINSIVSMSDDWRTTGLLMREMKNRLGIHLPPPWDLRKCSLALSSSPYREEFKELFETVINLDWNIIDYSLMDILLTLKIDKNLIDYIKNYNWAFLNNILVLDCPIKWHKFWNILMASLYYNFWDYNRMMSFLWWMLETKWKVLPVTIDEAFIFAETWGYELIYSQDKISNEADYNDALNKIRLVRDSNNASINKEVKETILEADYIIVWPGDLFTSIEANFLIKGFTELLEESNVKKIYIMNSNNKRWETTDYNEIDFVDFVENNLRIKIDLLVANSKSPKLTKKEEKKFKEDISVKWWRYLFIDKEIKKQIQKKYPHIEFLLWEYIDIWTLYKNNDRMIEDIVSWIDKN